MIGLHERAQRLAILPLEESRGPKEREPSPIPRVGPVAESIGQEQHALAPGQRFPGDVGLARDGDGF